MATEYVIRIEDATSQGSSSPVSGASEARQTPVTREVETAKPKIGADSYISSKIISPAARSVTTHITSTVGIETGSQELQQKTNLAMQTINTISSAYSNVAASTVLFGSFGVGLVATALGVVAKVATKQAQIDQEARIEGEQLALYRSRLGAAYNGNRSGGAT